MELLIFKIIWFAILFGLLLQRLVKSLLGFKFYYSLTNFWGEHCKTWYHFITVIIHCIGYSTIIGIFQILKPKNEWYILCKRTKYKFTSITCHHFQMVISGLNYYITKTLNHLSNNAFVLKRFL